MPSRSRNTVNAIMIVGLIGFGYALNDALDAFTGQAQAEVAGMSTYDLLRDRDFRYAVEDIARDVTRQTIQNCYVEGEYLYC